MSDEIKPVIVSSYDPPDYRPLLDDDLKALYKDKMHFTWEPLVAQTMRNMERLTIAINKLIEKDKLK